MRHINLLPAVLLLSFTAQAQVTLCPGVTNLQATNITSTSATALWEDTSSNTSYDIRYGVFLSSPTLYIYNIPITSVNLTGLIPGKKYQYSILPHGAACTGFYGSSSFFYTWANGDTYCASSGNAERSWIERVAVGTKGYTSGNNGGYGKFTNIIAPLKKGSVVPLTIIPGFAAGSSHSGFFRVYIDYNQDHDFNDSGEQVIKTQGDTVTKSFKVPLTANTGKTRIRIQFNEQANYLNQDGPCATAPNGESGETEDYTVNISDNSFETVANTQPVNKLVLTPMPVTGSTAYTTLTQTNAGKIQMFVTDVWGKRLLSQQTNVTAGKNTVIIHGLDKLSNGTFILIAEQDNSVIGKATFIVKK